MNFEIPTKKKQRLEANPTSTPDKNNDHRTDVLNINNDNNNNSNDKLLSKENMSSMVQNFSQKRRTYDIGTNVYCWKINQDTSMFLQMLFSLLLCAMEY